MIYKGRSCRAASTATIAARREVFPNEENSQFGQIDIMMALIVDQCEEAKALGACIDLEKYPLLEPEAGGWHKKNSASSENNLWFISTFNFTVKLSPPLGTEAVD